MHPRQRSILARWSMLLRQIRTTHTTSGIRDGRPVILRTRRWYAPLLVAAANAYLAWIDAGVRVLKKRQWVLWEREAHHVLNGVELSAWQSLPIEIPLYAGRTLDAILREGIGDTESAFRAAVRSLHEAHHAGVRYPDGAVRRFSHGDATARNVVVDLVAGRAVWIDFEIVHTTDRSDLCRFADDLHALLCSATEVWDAGTPEAVAKLCDWVKQEYADADVLRELANALERPGNAYQMARGIAEDSARQLMVQRLRQ